MFSPAPSLAARLPLIFSRDILLQPINSIRPGGVHKGDVGAAVAADVLLPRQRTYLTERPRILPRVARVCPRGAGCGDATAAVRPAEVHVHVHAGHEALAAASELWPAESGTSVGALLVAFDNGNPAKPQVVTDAVGMVSTRAVISRNQG